MTMAPGVHEQSEWRVRATLAAFVEGMSAGRARIGLPPLQGEPPAAGGAETAAPTAEIAAPDVARLLDVAARLGLTASSTGSLSTSSLATTSDRSAVRDAVELGVIVGLAHPYDPMAGLVDAVLAAVERIEPGIEIEPGSEGDGAAAGDAGAGLDVAAVAAVAAGVSCGIDAAAPEQRLALAAWAADDAAARSPYRPGPQLSARLTWACALAERSEGDPVDVLALLVGNSAAPQECVPAAFALAATHPDVPTTHRAACALGGRSDVVAAVAGAVRAGSAPAAPTTPAPTPEGDDPAVGAAADARQASEGLKGLAADLAARRATPGATT